MGSHRTLAIALSALWFTGACGTTSGARDGGPAEDAPGAEVRPADLADVSPTRDRAEVSGRWEITDTSRTADLADHGSCSVDNLAVVFEAQVRPWIQLCRPCHDQSVAPGLLKAPGPQWYHPDDEAYIVQYLIDNALIDANDAAASLFILKPLAQQDGGIKHTGGGLIQKDSDAYLGFMEFLVVASSCFEPPQSH
jgi:hypothetical protein